MADAEAAGEELTWRCKACGKRQRDPEPPCERCWNTTFVAGEGANDAAGGTPSLASPSSSPPAGTTAVQARRVRTATNRATAAAVLLAAALVVLQAVLPASSPLGPVVSSAAVAVGLLAVLFVVATLLVTLTDSVDGLLVE